MTISDSDMKFLTYTMVASLVIMGLLHLVPNTNAKAPPPMEISAQLRKEVVNTIKPLSTVDLRQALQINDGKPTFLFIYASWCPHCRTALPEFVRLQEKGALAKAQVIYFSTDRDPEKLIRYLAENNYHTLFTPYVFSDPDPQTLVRLVEDYGMSWQGGIPYAAILDKDGQLIAEVNRRNGWNDISRAMNQLR